MMVISGDNVKGAARTTLLTVLLAVFSSRLYGNTEDVQPRYSMPSTFEINTDMLMFPDPSSRMIRGWQDNANALFHKVHDGIGNSYNLFQQEKTIARAGVYAFSCATSLVVNRAFSLTAHDLGHMERARSIGASGVFLIREHSGRRMSVADFFLKSFNFVKEPGLYHYVKPGLTPEEEAAVSGQGLNINLQIAAETAEKITRGNGHITDTAPYMLNKVWGISYFTGKDPESDAHLYVESLHKQGHEDVSREKIIYLNAISFLASGGTISLLKGGFGYIARAETRMNPVTFSCGDLVLGWPEITTCLNPDNVSVLVSMDARAGKRALIRAGVESPVLGNLRVNPEFTVGMEYTVKRWKPGFEITSSLAGVPFVTGSISYAITGNFSIGAKGFYGSGNTQREWREYPGGPGGVLYVHMVF